MKLPEVALCSPTPATRSSWHTRILLRNLRWEKIDISAIELTRTDLELIKLAMDDARFEIVWIGDEMTTDFAFDVQLPDGDQTEVSVMQI